MNCAMKSCMEINSFSCNRFIVLSETKSTIVSHVSTIFSVSGI